MLNWYAIESTAYYAADAGSLSSDNLYFLTDTHELYRGTVPFTDAVVLYTGNLPSPAARKKVYINSTTLEGHTYDGATWHQIIKPVVATVEANGVNPVSGKAVADYVTAAIEALASSAETIAAVAYDKGTIKLTVTKGDNSTEDIILEGIGTQLAYDKTTGKLNLKDVKGTVLGSGIDLDLERFVKGAAYDHDTKTITMWFDDAADAAASNDKIEIPVGALVDTYTAESTATVQLTVTGNKFTANVLKSAASGNVLELKDDGLYVAATDLSNYMTLVASADTAKVPMLNAAGQVINGTMTFGGATIAGTPNATTLATEVAVNALVASTKATIDAELAKKMALVTGATENHVATFATGGQVKDSGLVVGGATLATNANATTLATEAAVKAADSALDAKIAANTGAINTLNGDASTAGSVDKKIADATAKMVETTDIATAINADVTNDQVAGAKAVYDSLTWKTSL